MKPIAPVRWVAWIVFRWCEPRYYKKMRQEQVSAYRGPALPWGQGVYWWWRRMEVRAKGWLW